MALPIWMDNLIAYSLQIAILASAGTLLVYAFRLRVPKVLLAYWQVLLLACLVLPGLQNWKHPVRFQAMATSVSIAYSIPPIHVASPPKSSFSITPEMIALALGSGICLRLMWLAVGFVRLRLFLRKSQPLSGAAPVSESLSSRIGVRARFFLSTEIDSPATVGVFSPTVILPGSFHGMSEACREAVVCHELLHVRRRDWVLILIEEIIRSVFWFHPAVWWLLARIHLAREQSVDHEVVRLTGSRQPYLDSLLEIARSRGRPRAVPAPLFLRERHLVQRVALLIKEVSMNRFRLAVSLAGMAVLLAGTVLLAAEWFPLTGDPEVIQPQVAQFETAQPMQNSGKTAGPYTSVEVMAEPPTISSPPPVIVAAAGPSPKPETAIKPQDRSPIRVGGNVQESKLIRRVEPIYPELALKARVSGKVTLTVSVNEQGFVSDIQVVSGHPLLTEAAVTAVKQWQYAPTTLNGVPVPVIATVTVVFAIKGDDVQVGSGPGAPAMPPIRPAGGLNSLVSGPDWLIVSRAAPIDEKGSASAIPEDFRAPEVALTPEDSFRLLKMIQAEWPADMAKGGPLAYSFIIDEAGTITNFARVQGPEIPGVERELSQMRVVSPGLRGSNLVRSWCTIEIRIDLTSDEIQSLFQANAPSLSKFFVKP